VALLEDREPGHGHAGRAQGFPHEALVAGGAGRLDAVAAEAEPGGRAGRDLGGGIVGGDEGVERLAGGQLDHPRRRPLLVAEGDLDGAEGLGGPQPGQLVAAVGPQHRLDAQPLRRPREVVGAVGLGRGQEEDALHLEPYWGFAGARATAAWDATIMMYAGRVPAKKASC